MNCIPKIAQEWLIEKKSGNPEVDSREGLETLGFFIQGETPLFYKVSPPEGFTKSTDGYWTSIFDATEKRVIMQFYSEDWGAEGFMNFQ